MRTLVLLALLASPAAADVFARYQCHRCHEASRFGLRAQDCVSCHRMILDGDYGASEEDLRRWRSHIVSLRVVPSLAGVRRLRRAWVRNYLLSPRDLRPNLRATMPRLPVTRADADAIARWLVPVQREVPLDGDVERGRRLYATLWCASCHAFGGGGPTGESDGIALAPDLAFTRERFQSGALVDFLRHPDDPMPDYGLDEASAAALAAFLWRAPREVGVPAVPVPSPLPLLARRVGFDEVNQRVFHNTCRHCHSQPELDFGDGGPGNTGGFGFAGKGLDLSSRLAIARGYVDEKGRRRSLFGPGPPLLIEALRARQREEAGEAAALRGMPLGLPALTPEELQLVESWVAQGRPE
jgi:Cytochrome C oxidase, cbb3-type, subunit III